VGLQQGFATGEIGAQVQNPLLFPSPNGFQLATKAFAKFVAIVSSLVARACVARARIRTVDDPSGAQRGIGGDY
jgi:hypothetical protein